MPVSDWLQLAGRPALVAGAGGLGGASAVALAAAGARVVVVDLSQSNLEAVKTRAKEAGAESEIIGMTADLRDPQGCRDAVHEAERRLGGLDVFLHAVGRNVRLPVLELDDDAWEQTLQLNLSTAWCSCRRCRVCSPTPTMLRTQPPRAA
jgi:gluconate 5-dehydrogenase